MAKQIIVSNLYEIETYRKIIIENLKRSVERIKNILNNSDTLSIFQQFKYEKSVLEPISGDDENLIEVINQSQTYLVSIKAVEYLFAHYPQQKFRINWGNICGYDIESIDGTIIAECFAATSYRSNGKLTADLKRLDNNNTSLHKYEFFFDKEFTDNHKTYYQEKYPNIEIVKFATLE